MPGPAKSPPSDSIYDSIGEIGRWQVYICILVAVSKFPVGWLQLSTVFLAPPATYYCVDPGNSTKPCSSECNKVEYDRSIFKETMITEWDLICEEAYLVNFAQTIYVFGLLVGNVSFGVWSDMSGRRIPLVCAVLLQMFSGLLAAFSPYFWLFVLLRFFCGVASGGSMMAGFCLIMEIVGPSHREVLAGILYQVPFNLGHFLLSPIAYFVRHFRDYQYTLSVLSLVLTSYICLIPESPRWLMVHGHIDEAVRVLEKAAVMNHLPTENIRSNVLYSAKPRPSMPFIEKGNVFDLLRTPKLRRNTLCIFYTWFAVGFNYFGVSQYVAHLGGNIFINVAVSALFGVPGLLTATPGCKYVGRKPTLATANLIVAVCMFVFIFVPKDFITLHLVLASLSMFGAAMQFPTVYLYAGEIFPTVARNAGTGLAASLARVGAMSAAQVALLMEVAPWIPPLLFATFGLLGAILTLLLPETKGEPLPDTLEDAEFFGRKHS